MLPQVFSSTEVAHITGISRQRLDYWARTKLLRPSIRDAHGKGTRRLYSLDDLVQLQFVQRLHTNKWSTQKIRKAITRLRVFLTSSEEAVLIDGKNTILALFRTKRGEQILLDTLSSGGQQVLEIVLETLIEETRNIAERVVAEGIHNA